MELAREMRTYPPLISVSVRMEPSLHSYKLPIKFEGCMNENLDTELMFPLENPVLDLTFLMCKLCRLMGKICFQCTILFQWIRKTATQIILAVTGA
jgi:hypothetical protein